MGVSLPLSSLLIVQNRAKNMTKMTCSCTKKLGGATMLYGTRYGSVTSVVTTQ